MSYYYQYYLGYIKDNKIYPYGPFMFDGRIKPIIEKSRSFASNLYQDFSVIKNEQISDELRTLFEYENYQGEKKIEVKYLPINELPSTDYIKKGYFPIENVQIWEESEYDDFFYDMISPLIYAEKLKKEVTFGKNQPKKDIEGEEYTELNASDYMYYAAPQYNSKEYESFLLSQAVDSMYDYEFFSDENVKMVILETEG